MANGVGAENQRRGRLLVVSGPSGSGKTTIVKSTLALGEFPIGFSVSATSRTPRPGEIPGKHYDFVSREAFERMRDAGAFLEYAEVHGNWYGTPATPVRAALNAGHWVLLEIDVQGFRQVKRALPDTLSCFIRAPSLDVYEQRVRARGAESEAAIARRMDVVRQELASASEYDFQMINESIEQAVQTFRTLLWGIRARELAGALTGPEDKG